MKSFNIFGVHRKIIFLERVMKNRYIGSLPKKREAWTVCRFKGELDKKEGGVFEGVIPQCTLRNNYVNVYKSEELI